MAKGAALNKHASRQDWCTPPEFLAAVQRRFGRIIIDLACTDENAVVRPGLTDSLVYPWEQIQTPGETLCWLNPPFRDITPWVMKASEAGVRIAVLIPASVGSNWWRDHVHGIAQVHFLNGRITFVGATDAYPRDCALLLYGPGFEADYHVWSWIKETPNVPQT